jgi:hypothetical protein
MTQDPGIPGVHVYSYTYMVVQLQGRPGTEASPCPGDSRPPSVAPTPSCLPACSHLCTTMSGIFLSAQLCGGGGAWGHEHCLHLGLSQRRTRQAAPTPPAWLEGRDSGLGQAAQIPGRSPHQ